MFGFSRSDPCIVFLEKMGMVFSVAGEVNNIGRPWQGSSWLGLTTQHQLSSAPREQALPRK
jgi:hypothetical protein